MTKVICALLAIAGSHFPRSEAECGAGWLSLLAQGVPKGRVIWDIFFLIISFPKSVSFLLTFGDGLVTLCLQMFFLHLCTILLLQNVLKGLRF